MIETKSLTKEQTNLYFKYLKEGRKEYREKIIIGNYRLVIHLALKYVNTEFELDDLVSTGVIGLIKAVDKFDIDKGINFSTYASRCINNEILMTLRHKKKWISLNDSYYQSKDGKVISLEDELSDNKNLEEMIVERESFNRNMAVLKTILDNIEPQERQIILDYFGINCPPLTQNQLAEKYDVSRSFIAKTIAKTLKELNNWMTFDKEVNSLRKLLTKK